MGAKLGVCTWTTKETWNDHDLVEIIMDYGSYR